jgi:hypothetical protein
MRRLLLGLTACLVGLAIAAPASADEDDYSKKAWEAQKKYEESLRKFQKKQEEQYRKAQKEYAERLRDLQKKQWKRYEEQLKRDREAYWEGGFPGGAFPHYPSQPAYPVTPPAYPDGLSPGYFGPLSGRPGPRWGVPPAGVWPSPYYAPAVPWRYQQPPPARYPLDRRYGDGDD